MKKLVLIGLVVAVIGLSSSNTASAQGISVELGFNYNQPGGDFGDIYLGGAGISLHPRYKLTDKMAVGLNVGANAFIGGDVDDINNPNLDSELSAAGIVSILGTLQYKLLDKKITPYGEIGIGTFKAKSADISTVDINGDPEIVEDSYFGFAPKVGVMLGFLNASASYIAAGDLKYTQFALGFRFGKK